MPGATRPPWGTGIDLRPVYFNTHPGITSLNRGRNNGRAAKDTLDEYPPGLGGRPRASWGCSLGPPEDDTPHYQRMRTASGGGAGCSDGSGVAVAMAALKQLTTPDSGGCTTRVPPPRSGMEQVADGTSGKWPLLQAVAKHWTFSMDCRWHRPTGASTGIARTTPPQSNPHGGWAGTPWCGRSPWRGNPRDHVRTGSTATIPRSAPGKREARSPLTAAPQAGAPKE